MLILRRRLFFSLFVITVCSYLNTLHAELAPRLIVKYKNALAVPSDMSDITTQSRNRHFKDKKFIQLESVMTSEEIQQKIEAIKSKDNTVEYVEVDTIMTINKEPGDYPSVRDNYYNQQWALYDSLGGIRMPEAWDITMGNSGTIIAVVDTGILNHEDLAGRILPGVNVIENSEASGVPNRSNDASDLGDYCYKDGSFSSWHGTHVAGTILANSGNGIGIAGVNWQAKLLPVRALGRCGGYASDIADGIRWAVGLPVGGVMTNPNPAKVINLSLGGEGDCGHNMQSAINQARARGAVVVVAAGNQGANLDYGGYTPANCHGVIVVGATNANGSFSNYSNYGAKVDISAPGGDNWYGGIISLSNDGSTFPMMNTYRPMIGTSMAAPHVAGVVSLVMGKYPNLYPDQIKDIIKKSARAFRYDSCFNGGCGVGILDAYNALVRASNTTPDPDFRVVEPVTVGNGFDAHEINAQESGGGICGTVDFGGGFDNDDESGGVGDSKHPFILTLLIMLGLMAKFQIRNNVRK